jgi:excisionase family DNA binding protein
MPARDSKPPRPHSQRWASNELRCSVPSTRKLIAQGLLRGYRVGTHWKFTAEEIDKCRERLKALAMGDPK